MPEQQTPNNSSIAISNRLEPGLVDRTAAKPIHQKNNMKTEKAAVDGEKAKPAANSEVM